MVERDATITAEDIERRRLELELEPHAIAWARIQRAIEAADGSPAGRAPVAADVRCALRLVDEADVRGVLAREAERLARDSGIELRAQEILRTLAAEERSEPRENGRDSAQSQGRPVAIADPEPWPEPVDGSDLLEELVATLRRFVALPAGADIAIALWAIHAHAHDAAWVSPILTIRSPEKRCGKTTLLYVLSSLVPRPLAAANLTPAALFRSVEAFRPTLLLDEADAFLTGRTPQEELRGLINSGHTRAGAMVIRVVGDEHETRAFSTWAPKAIALIGDLPPTLDDRSIIIAMRRRAPGEELERLRLDQLSEQRPLQRRTWTWARANLERLRSAEPDVPSELHDRAADNWRPLLAIADVAGGDWPVRAREACLALMGFQDEAEASVSVQLLSDVKEIFGRRGVDRLRSTDISASLAEREDRPWPEWRRGQPITTRQLARLLRPFGIRPKQLWIDGENRQGYERRDFEDAFTRYTPGFGRLGSLESSTDAGFPGFFDSLGPEPPRDVENVERARGDCDLGTLGDQTGGTGKLVWEEDG